MRKILFTVFAGALIIVGCSKSSDSPASIVGTWQVNKVITTEYSNGIQTFSDTTTEGSITFKSDGTAISTDNTGESDTSNYSYNSSTKILTGSDGTETVNFHVTNLTGSNLHYTYDSTATVPNVPPIRVVVDADYKR